MSKFRFGITHRLGLGFGFMLVLMLALTVVSVTEVNRLNANLAQINEVNSVKQRFAINYRGSVHDRAIAIRDVAMLSGKERADAEALIGRLAADYARNEVAMAEMIAGPAGASDEERRILAEIDDIQARANPLVAEIIALRDGGDTAAALDRLALVRPLFDAWLGAINRFIDHHEAANRSIGAQVDEAAGSFQSLASWSLGIAVLLALAAAALVSRSITAPLGRLSKVMQRMAQGDYEAAVPHAGRRDEIGDMAATVEVFRTNGLMVAQVTASEAERVASALDAKGQMDAVSRSQAVIEFDPEGTVLRANDNFRAVTGYAAEEIVGRHHRMFVDPSEAQGADYAELWRRLRGGEFVAGEFRRIAHDGREVWLQASYNPIFDLEGKVVKVVKFATDVTGRVHAVTQIGTGLGLMAGGDLVCEITTPFIPTLDRLRLDFNDSVATLRRALQTVGQKAFSIDAAANEVRSAADDLSRRTEQQAASVEQTAAALEEITVTVRNSAQRAEDAGALVKRARGSAEKSETVVRQAIATMGEIERSSREVGNIIGVIDEIAFQTNLLALNAGVEAARAGDAGRGFAVVAQEVRGLAQRSAEAAKQIKELITKSGGEVKSGVALVGDTGAALQAIIGDVKEISDHVVAIVEASREQSTSLVEVNTAVGMIDQGTQQNAAMVEETSAASQALAGEAQDLNRLLGEFRLGDAPPATAHAADTGRQAARMPAAAAQFRGAGMRPGGARPAVAFAEAPQDDGWEEF